MQWQFRDQCLGLFLQPWTCCCVAVNGALDGFHLHGWTLDKSVSQHLKVFIFLNAYKNPAQSPTPTTPTGCCTVPTREKISGHLLRAGKLLDQMCKAYEEKPVSELSSCYARCVPQTGISENLLEMQISSCNSDFLNTIPQVTYMQIKVLVLLIWVFLSTEQLYSGREENPP